MKHFPYKLLTCQSLLVTRVKAQTVGIEQRGSGIGMGRQKVVQERP